MKRIIIILILSSFLSFIACKNSTETEIRNMYIAEWKSTKKPVPYTATLKINNDNTFDFNSGACMSSTTSKGKWRIENDTIILNSFKPRNCCFLIVFGGNCEKYGKAGENHMFRKSFEDCDMKIEDMYDVFENTKFFIKNEKLIFKKSKINDCEDLEKWNNDFDRGKTKVK